MWWSAMLDCPGCVLTLAYDGRVIVGFLAINKLTEQKQQSAISKSQYQTKGYVLYLQARFGTLQLWRKIMLYLLRDHGLSHRLY